MRLRAGDRTVEVSKPDKIFFPDDGITKAGLAQYYQRIAPWMLRHVRARPVAAERYPDGIKGERFFQKNVPDHYPDWIRRIAVPNKEDGTTTHAVCDEAADLVYLADQGTATPHTWLSRADKLDVPDRVIIDLDPPEGYSGDGSSNTLELLRFAARQVRALLEEVGLVPYLMTSGSRGYHVVSPLRRDHEFDDVRDFTREVATLLAQRHPDRLTVEQRTDQRGDRIFLDYLRNAYAQTSVPPYAVRAKPTAPVAAPLWWEELDRTTPQQYTIGDAVDRVRDVGDPWSGLANRARSLSRPVHRLRWVLS